jgi:hypothetical protein
MHKFTSILIAGLASVASARLTSTGAVNKLNRQKNGAAGEAYDTRITVIGLQQEMSKNDLKTIGESAVAAYNDVFSEVGFAIDGLETHVSIPLDSMSWAPLGKAMVKSSAPPPPDDDSTITDDNENEIMYDDDTTPPDKGDDDNSGWCGRSICPNDIDDSILHSNAVHAELIFAGVDWYNNQDGRSSAVLPNIAQLYMAFEASFCSTLRSSGLTNLVNVKECSFSFVEKPGSSTNTSPVDSPYASSANNQGAKMEAHITMMGLLHDFSNADRDLINQSILSAHSKVFSSTGYSLKSFNVVSDVDVPPLAGDDYKDSRDAGCIFLCTSNGDAAVTLISAIAVAANDSEVANDHASFGQLYMHEAFEKSFCTKLQISGSANFANVHDCSFRFVGSPRFAQVAMTSTTA